MDNSARWQAFEAWASKTYRRRDALRLYQALKDAGSFLREIGAVHNDLLTLPAEEAVRLLAALNGNRVFRFRCKDAAACLGKLSRAIHDFASGGGGASTQENPDNARPAAMPENPVAFSDGESGMAQSEGVAPSPCVGAEPAPVPEAPLEASPLEKAVRNIVERCLILLDGMVISKEDISQSLMAFFSRVSEQRAHNIGVVLHTGSIVFDALAVFWAAIASLLSNESSPEETVRALQKGDLVIHKGTDRCRFEGLTTIGGEEYAELAQDDRYNSRIKVHISQWGQIMPYLGNSTRLDRRGVRGRGQDQKKQLFYTQVLNVAEQDIPSVTDTSTVFIMPRDRADCLLKGLCVSFGSEMVNLLDLVTASFYTDSDEFPYGGNSGKNEPVLKFASRLSVGRKQVVKRGGNRNAGLFLCGEDVLRKTESELPEMLERKSLQYVFVLANTGAEEGQELIERYEDAEVLACTREFIRSFPRAVRAENSYTVELQAQLDAVLNHQTLCIPAENGVDWDTYEIFRRSLFALKNSCGESGEKNDFVVGAWSVFKLLRTMVFPVALLEDMVENGKIKTVSLQQRIESLEERASSLPDELRGAAQEAVGVLRRSYVYLRERDGEKQDFATKAQLLRALVAARAGAHVCVIVPKTWYEPLLRASGLYDLMEEGGKLTVVTANRFDGSVVYDTIITVGEFHSKRFDCFRCMSATETISLVCGFEQNFWRRRKKQADRAVSVCNARARIQAKTVGPAEDAPWQGGATEAEILDAEREEMDFDAFLEQQMLLADIPAYARGSGQAAKETEIAAIVTFETGERAYLTPFYTACVFDGQQGNVTEKSINDNDLCEGDFVVFTRNDNEMHDIVDDILQMLLSSGRLKERERQDYRRSKVWRNKLRYFARLSGLQPSDIAKKLTAGGAPITEQTVRIWMDADAHTVGPRKVETIREIGRIVQDLEMEQHPEITMESCDRIRRRRRRILGVIEKSIIDKISGRKNRAADSLEQEIYSRMDSQADVLQVSSFVRVERTVPSTWVNRPINL